MKYMKECAINQNSLHNKSLLFDHDDIYVDPDNIYVA